MDSPSLPGHPLAPVARHWSSHYLSRRFQVYRAENRAFSPGTGAFITRFTRRMYNEGIGPYSGSSLVDALCSTATIPAASSRHRGATLRLPPCPPCALLDDRNYNDAAIKSNSIEGNRRPYLGPLTVEQLYQELSKPRFPSFLQTDGGLVKRETLDHDAERRLIYITDPDANLISTIAATSSWTQRVFLRSFLHHHIAWVPSIRIGIEGTGVRPFGLEFHFPYLSYKRRSRRDAFVVDDCRKKRNGKPLRRTEDITFLSMTPDDTTDPPFRDYLHQAHVSCLVTGVDEWVWTGYCFLDTYHHGTNHTGIDSVQDYDKQAKTTSMLDPLCAGRHPMNRPIWKPREYFVTMLRSWASRVKDEWENVVSMVLEHTEPYVCDYDVFNDKMTNIKSDVKRTQHFLHWTSETLGVLKRLKKTLFETLDAWDRFQTYGIGYLEHVPAPGDCARSQLDVLDSIRDDFDAMRRFLRALDHEIDLCETLSQKLLLHLTQEGQRCAVVQENTGEHVKLMAVITLLSVPLSLSTSIFALPSDIIRKPNLGSFVATVIALGITLVIVLTWSLGWTWHKRLAKQVMLTERRPRQPRWRRHRLGGSWFSEGGTEMDDVERDLPELV